VGDEQSRTTNEVQLNTSTAVGVFQDVGQATLAARRLDEAGYGDALSIVSLQGKPIEESTHETGAARGGISGAAAGAIFGGLALAAIAVGVPGVGTVIAGGPLVAGLAGAFGGASAGGLVGSFVGLGITTEHAKRYADAVRRGQAVVSVDTSGHAQADTACELMKGAGAMEVASYDAML
jgi:hypothetical protein